MGYIARNVTKLFSSERKKPPQTPSTHCHLANIYCVHNDGGAWHAGPLQTHRWYLGFSHTARRRAVHGGIWYLRSQKKHFQHRVFRTMNTTSMTLLLLTLLLQLYSCYIHLSHVTYLGVSSLYVAMSRAKGASIGVCVEIVKPHLLRVKNCPRKLDYCERLIPTTLLSRETGLWMPQASGAIHHLTERRLANFSVSLWRLVFVNAPSSPKTRTWKK